MNFDFDLQAIQEVRDACRTAKVAQSVFKELTQEQVDQVVTAVYEAGYQAAEQLAQMAVDETGFGRLADKIAKNQFATKRIYEYIRPLKTVGIIEKDSTKKVAKIAEPMGVVAGIIPSTNPTSTTLFKALIAIKSRNAIVFSPHPNAMNCIVATTNIIREAAEKAGAPPGLVQCLSHGVMAATTELMQHKDVAVILATGGSGLVKAAYSAGKPAYGVGPGNVPAFIERTANVPKAVKDIIISKTFDNGTICASEQAVVVDTPVKEAVLEEFKKAGAYFLSPEESIDLAKVLVTPRLTVNPKLVGQPAFRIAAEAGISVPENTSVLISRQTGVGEDFPLTIEKLSPVLALFIEDGWEAGCERCIELLNFGGLGHTLVIHSQDENVILEFGLKKPAFRILVNAPGTQGAIGMTTDLEPSLTLGCGTFGGNITADNVTPMHLLNIKRLAYEVRPINPMPTEAFTESIAEETLQIPLVEPEPEIKTEPEAEIKPEPETKVITKPESKEPQKNFPYQKVLEPWKSRKQETPAEPKPKPTPTPPLQPKKVKAPQPKVNDFDIEQIVKDVLKELEK